MDRVVRSQSTAILALICGAALLFWISSPQRILRDIRKRGSLDDCYATNHFFGSYIGASLVSDLNTCHAPGRLGNRVFQNLAVSLIAQRFDLATRYSLESECNQLGLQLFSGRRFMTGRNVDLADGSLRSLLEDKLGGAHKRGESDAAVMEAGAQYLLSASNTYFQSPWFARKLRSNILPAMRKSILHANPWRKRVGQNNDTFVHVRIGDMNETARSVHDYAAAVVAARCCDASRHLGHIYIASDSADHEIVRELARRFQATVLHNLDRVEIIQFGATAKSLVLSDGTFSWFIGVMADVLAGRGTDAIPVKNEANIRFLSRSFQWVGDIFVFKDWVRH